MTQVVAIAYPPGAYGSFVSWTVDRFSKIRSAHAPAITDDPLSSDGSSHGYVSHCSIDSLQDFMQGLDAARQADTKWKHQVHAGWPRLDNVSIDQSISNILDWMAPYDKLITVEPTDPDMHYICYLRGEATIDADRWYGMLGIEQGDVEGLAKKLERDVLRPRSKTRDDDPRWLRLGVGNILNYNTEPQLFDMIAKHLAWPVIDKQLFVDTCKRMRGMQQRYFAGMMQAKQGNGTTPAQQAIHIVHQKRKV